MVFQEFKKTVNVLKSHNLANGFISITYSTRGDGYTTTSRTIHTENSGGAVKSLYEVLVNGQSSQRPIRDNNTGKIIGYA